MVAIDAAIDVAHVNGHVASYSTEIQGVTYRGLAELYTARDKTINEIASRNRGSRFGGIGFGRVTS